MVKMEKKANAGSKDLREKMAKRANKVIVGRLGLRGLEAIKEKLVKRVKMENLEIAGRLDHRGLEVIKEKPENVVLKVTQDVMVKTEKKANAESKNLKVNVENKGLKVNAGNKGLVEKILLLPQIQCHNQCLTLHLSQWTL
ncbi:hypothetical protein, partial [Streptococcus equi]